MPANKEDHLCVPCLIIFCIIATAIVVLVKCIQVTCDRNRRAAGETPSGGVDTELVYLDDGGNKIVVNPDGDIMAAMSSPTKARGDGVLPRF
jgi:hypothetical protein